MAGKSAKYDPLEAAKLGTTPAPSEPASAEASAPPVAEVELEDAEATPSPHKRYLVKTDCRVSINGNQHPWKAGRVVDSAGYDIEKLLAQGVPLEQIKE